MITSLQPILRTRTLVLAWLVIAAPSATIAGSDALTIYHKERIRRLGIREALSHDNATFIAKLLSDPSSPYSDVIEQPVLANDVDWANAVAAWPAADQDTALRSLQRTLGLTRARPRVDVMPLPGFRDDFVAASATKARVDADIFWHALDLTGYSHSTKAAVYAIALQRLRDQVAGTPDPARRNALGIEKPVLDRMMKAQTLDRIPASDLRYLGLLVQHLVVHRVVDEESTLPASYRIARIAAAYRDLQGYVSAPPCTPDATPRPSHAGTGSKDDPRPLCFVAATDRAVHRWYLAEARRQARGAPDPNHVSLIARLEYLIAPVLVLLDIAALVEVGEMLIADEMVAEGSLSDVEADVATSRVSRLSCPVEG
ncbi:hypothetical protein P3W33_17765 [Luteibacter sp. PPL552]|jgi:hypothetical protein